MKTKQPKPGLEPFEINWSKLTDIEHRIVHRIANRAPVSRNINKQFEDERTFGERLADSIARFGGSWTFILLFLCMLSGWVAINSVILARRSETFDPYPYILLNLFLSMIAALQAPVIMMSQNRQSARDRLNAAHDYEVNLKAELEIVSLHQKLDELQQNQWRELIEMQQEQIRKLQQILETSGGHSNAG